MNASYIRQPAPDLDELRNRSDYEPRRPSDVIVRAALAAARHVLSEDQDAQEIARSLWSQDRDLPVLVRAATSPATAAAGGWGSGLATTAVADLITSLGPISAGSELLRRALVLNLDRAYAVSVPSFSSSAGNIAFVQEGAPIPFQQLLLGGPVLSRRKLAVGVVLTREVIESSVPSAEKLVRAALSESLALALDAALFDAVAVPSQRRRWVGCNRRRGYRCHGDRPN